MDDILDEVFKVVAERTKLRLLPVPSEKPTVDKIAEMAKKGYTRRQAANELGMPYQNLARFARMKGISFVRERSAVVFRAAARDRKSS